MKNNSLHVHPISDSPFLSPVPTYLPHITSFLFSHSPFCTEALATLVLWGTHCRTFVYGLAQSYLEPSVEMTQRKHGTDSLHDYFYQKDNESFGELGSGDPRVKAGIKVLFESLEGNGGEDFD